MRAELVGGPNDGQHIEIGNNSPIQIKMPITYWPGIITNPANYDPFADKIALYRKRIGVMYQEYADAIEVNFVYDFEGME